MRRFLYLFILIIVVILLSCSDDKSTEPEINNPSEEWAILIDDGLGEGSMILELQPDSTITAEGSWIFDYEDRYVVTCNFMEGEAVLNGSDLNCSSIGTAQNSGNNTSSEFSIVISGMLTNGLGAGSYQIEFSDVNWQENIEGDWTAELIDGDGITGNELYPPVFISTFTGFVYSGFPQLQWIAQSETNCAGWNILRSETDNSEEGLKINYDLIPGAGTTTEVSSYSYIDAYELCADTTYYYYWLEAIDVLDNSFLFGPICLIYIPEGNEPELPVYLSSFTGIYSSCNVLIQWVTQSETNNAGWNLYRSETDNSVEGLMINYYLIPGGGSTTEPTEYSFTDEFEICEGTYYYYWLESIDFSGNTESFGPICVYIPEEEEEDTPPVP